jgi:hypothetical protein
VTPDAATAALERLDGYVCDLEQWCGRLERRVADLEQEVQRVERHAGYRLDDLERGGKR